MMFGIFFEILQQIKKSFENYLFIQLFKFITKQVLMWINNMQLFSQKVTIFQNFFRGTYA